MDSGAGADDTGGEILNHGRIPHHGTLAQGAGKSTGFRESALSRLEGRLLMRGACDSSRARAPAAENRGGRRHKITAQFTGLGRAKFDKTALNSSIKWLYMCLRFLWEPRPHR